LGGHAEILGEHVRRRMGDPVGDAERSELGEIAIVEDKDEQAILRSEPLDRVTEPAREIPDIAGAEVGDLRTVFRVDGGDAAAPL
jgi:hypothetical protein